MAMGRAVENPKAFLWRQATENAHKDVSMFSRAIWLIGSVSFNVRWGYRLR